MTALRPATGLLDLPVEIILHIINQIPQPATSENRFYRYCTAPPLHRIPSTRYGTVRVTPSTANDRIKDLSSLCRAHSSLHHILTPFLYDGNRELALLYGASTGNATMVAKALEDGGLDIDGVYLHTSDRLELARVERAGQLEPRGGHRGKNCSRRANEVCCHFQKYLNGGTSALSSAVAYEQLDMARLLLTRGAKVTRFPGPPLLHMATVLGYTEMVMLLLESPGGRDAMELGRRGSDELGSRNTPLYVAVYDKHVDMVNLLLEQGADVDRIAEEAKARGSIRESKWGVSTLDWSLLCADQETFEALLRALSSRGAREWEWSLLRAAAAAEQMPKLRFLVEAGRAAEASRSEGTNDGHDPSGSDDAASWLQDALFAAIYYSRPEALEYLLENGADMSKKTDVMLWERNASVFHVAAEGPAKGRTKIIEILLEHAARRGLTDLIESRTTGHPERRAVAPGQTPLLSIFAINRHGPRPRGTECAESARLLIEAGADIMAKSTEPAVDNGKHRNALWYVAVSGCYACRKVVLANLGYERAMASIAENDPLVMGKTWRKVLGQAWQEEFGARVEEQQRRRARKGQGSHVPDNATQDAIVAG